MKIKNLIFALLFIGALASCKKDASISDESTIGKEKTGITSDSLNRFSLDSAKKNRLAVTVPTGTVNGLVPFYRLFSIYEAKHFFTLGAEANILLAQMRTDIGPFPVNNWSLEGEVCRLEFRPTGTFTVPLYRYYRNTGDHYYSNSPNAPLYYVPEGIMGYMSATQVLLSSPLHSYFKKTGTFDRLYTKDFNELGTGNKDWQYEGIIGWVY
ncbi:hypothetical protein [Pedobacter mendelii]|uniref:DUF5648 domain-containing protein n=1 Tax=Pedobacter mendelii TaxID=1908240 RepID=A0ABQ2BMS2_9SPHI|nr:hypothetical protein [Pedobacter mendelii]GGI28395.1 hypothetical protein GCM10008119_32430 [Pedobacter mendelii]